MGIFKSKAIGEPMLIYGIEGYFAIMNAFKAFRLGDQYEISAPITPKKYGADKVDEKFKKLLALYKQVRFVE